MQNISDAEDCVDSWVAGVTTQAAQAVELSERVARLCGVAQNPDGLVKVRVGPGGQVLALALEDGACHVGGPRLAEQIMSVMRAAQADVRGGVSDAVHATVGAHTETGRAILDAFDARFPPRKASNHNTSVSEDRDGDLSVVA